jgi:lysophospholipase L1-like esterase
VSNAKIKRIVDSYVRWHEILKQRNSKLMIAIIPQTGSVYEDAFPEKERKRINKPTIKERVQKALREQGIRVIDLMPLYTQNRTPYLYLRDDTHWNARTVKLTAEHMAKVLRSQNWLSLPE